MVEAPAGAYASYGAPNGVVVMNGVTYARPDPVRWVCFRRDRKLMFFLVIALMAGMTMIILYAFAAPQTGVLIMAIIIALVLGLEYFFLGKTCYVDPFLKTTSCDLR